MWPYCYNTPEIFPCKMDLRLSWGRNTLRKPVKSGCGPKKKKKLQIWTTLCPNTKWRWSELGPSACKWHCNSLPLISVVWCGCLDGISKLNQCTHPWHRCPWLACGLTNMLLLCTFIIHTQCSCGTVQDWPTKTDSWRGQGEGERESFSTREWSCAHTSISQLPEKQTTGDDECHQL